MLIFTPTNNLKWLIDLKLLFSLWEKNPHRNQKDYIKTRRHCTVRFKHPHHVSTHHLLAQSGIAKLELHLIPWSKKIFSKKKATYYTVSVAFVLFPCHCSDLLLQTKDTNYIPRQKTLSFTWSSDPVFCCRCASQTVKPTGSFLLTLCGCTVHKPPSPWRFPTLTRRSVSSWKDAAPVWLSSPANRVDFTLWMCVEVHEDSQTAWSIQTPPLCIGEAQVCSMGSDQICELLVNHMVSDLANDC